MTSGTENVTSRGTSALSHAAYQGLRHFESLDGIRCLCIAAVLWHHSMSLVLPWPIVRSGMLGVDMFFVLSGYLIVTLLLREKDRHGRISLAFFYVRRSLRILPIYYLLVLGTGVLVLFLPPDSETRRSVDAFMPYALTYTMNFAPDSRSLFGHLWSLSVEEQFYLLWPIAECVLSRGAMRVALIALCVFTVCAHAGGLRVSQDYPFTSLILLHGPFARPIVWGVVLAHVLHNRDGYARLRSLLGWRASSAVTATLLLTVVAVYGPERGVSTVVIHLLMTLFLASCVIVPDHSLAPLLRARPIAYLGTISYGIYIYHLHVRYLTVNALGNTAFHAPWWTFLVTSIGSIALAATSHALLESRLIAFGRRFRQT